MREIVAELIKDAFTYEIGELSYNLGKWIYLIDALDDFDKDLKNGEYNVFVNAYKGVNSKEELVREKITDLQNIFGTIISDITSFNEQIDYKFNKDLINNVLLNGLRKQTIMIMENEKCKKTTKS